MISNIEKFNKTPVCYNLVKTTNRGVISKMDKKEGNYKLEKILSKDVLTGAEIKAVRESLGITITDLAKRAGVRRETVSYWENERALPSPANRERLNIAFKEEFEAAKERVDAFRKSWGLS